MNEGFAMSTVPVALTATTDVALPADREQVASVRRILFFDGVCGLCNWSVDFVLKRDAAGCFQFSPLQGDTAKALLTPAEVQDLDSVVLWIAGKSYRKSAAAVRVLWGLGPFWMVVGVLLWFVPLPLRNLGYTIVAKNRYRWFGKKETCRIPSPEERIRFLP